MRPVMLHSLVSTNLPEHCLVGVHCFPPQHRPPTQLNTATTQPGRIPAAQNSTSGCNPHASKECAITHACLHVVSCGSSLLVHALVFHYVRGAELAFGISQSRMTALPQPRQVEDVEGLELCGGCSLTHGWGQDDSRGSIATPGGVLCR